jgi:hypothetical protein
MSMSALGRHSQRCRRNCRPMVSRPQSTKAACLNTTIQGPLLTSESRTQPSLSQQTQEAPDRCPATLMLAITIFMPLGQGGQ